MKIRPLTIEGAFEITPVQHGDDRGRFLEWYRFDRLAEAVGHQLDLAQANLSTSARGVVRGIHFADVPPGQAKYVTCVAGAIIDVIVDLRTGSPTFGSWEAVRLDDEDRRAVYLAEGLGHGFCALSEGATVAYLCSSTYRPGHEHGIHPLDPELGIAWPVAEPVLSAKDAAAPSLAEAGVNRMLPQYEVCNDFVKSLSQIGDSR
ncbi:dTDP-4-dehydrorhamnose 3,5-epimerase [Actinoplanes derwentensis]|uniref:dTDP-4-dehydrorhamnose 3,5-epimerase n=1 Tax=Actinoplanes derwentensis TaxID=113562 RepID=A0A1H2BCX5_9ACTN|nr:dTDP-4-dehydrorhamnose 3,5-epimerase [Actinoplanes derwentensis]GID88634.1 DTDP-4-dehydrorhamnose 3,5-epimerase RmlC [Actinoplanes derwentensis]SDT55917.1 dTDP-4-dehydrorhamnose 3,5-epimerase [Actinoplanes derwentensis]